MANRKENTCTKHLKILQEALVSLLVLSIVFLVLTMKTLSIFAGQSMDPTGTGRTLLTKGKDDFQITLTHTKRWPNA
jgi:hypothetical protein